MTDDNAMSSADGGHNYPPGTVWMVAGQDDAVKHSIVRFTTPSRLKGRYEVETTARPHLVGSISGDTDYHVVKNGKELYGKFIPGRNGLVVYKDVIRLKEGDILDFVMGPGADGREYASGLIVSIVITKVK
jgi:hypothetical protein